MTASPSRAAIPAVDRVLKWPTVAALVEAHGAPLVTETVRDVLAEIRAALSDDPDKSTALTAEPALAAAIGRRVAALMRAPLRPVFNLTGTILHTNLGRAPLPEEAIDAIVAVARGASNLEYDLEKGRRGDRDSHLVDWVRRLTGAEAATVVNNNAAAVLLVLNTLAQRKEVPVSRGELIEIGGAFRIPDIMARAGCRLVEVGTTNRTHLRDYENAMGARTGAIMKVHTSNYAVLGFTAAVAEADLAALAHRHDVPFAVDLGSGMLTELERWGLPHEPTPRDSFAAGADVVTFSGDKLLGGPQAGIICGKAALVDRIARNPLKRALRTDKMTIAALSAVLPMFADPERLGRRLPVLRLLTRARDDIRATADRIAGPIAARLGAGFSVSIVDCDSQFGSGALPLERLPSAAVAIRPNTGRRGAGRALNRLADAFRRLPVPVIGRIDDGALLLDTRCLEDVDGFLAQLPELDAG